jgi:flagellar motor switch protein FliM
MMGEPNAQAGSDGAAGTDAAAPGDGHAAISEEEVSALLEKSAADAAVPFDLSSRRVSRTQLPMLEFICKNFAARVGASLSGLLSRDVAMQFDTLQSVKAGDLAASLPLPAAVAVVRIKPLPGLALVNVEPSLLLMMLDAFFGGSGRAIGDSQAAAAPAAQRFLGLLVRSCAADLSVAWAPVAALEMEVVKQESNPRFLQLGESQDMFVTAKFSVTFGANSGQIDWLLPESLLAPVHEALASDGGKPAARTQTAWAPVIGASLQGAELEARAILAEAQISLGELVRLNPGDIIPIEAPQQVTLLAGNVPLYRGKFGVSKGRNALKIMTRGFT